MAASAPRPFPPVGKHRPDEAAMLSLHLTETGQRGKKTLPRDLRTVDAGEQRLGDLVQSLPSHAPCNEVPERFVLIAVAPWNDEVETHPQLAERRDERREQERAELGGHQEHDPLRHLYRPAAGEYIDAPGFIVRAQETSGQSHFSSQIQRPRLLYGKKGVRPGFHDKGAGLGGHSLSTDFAAKATALLQH